MSECTRSQPRQQPRPQLRRAQFTLDLSSFQIGDKVCLGEALATVQFVGHTKFAAGTWLGIELQEPIGKHDGKVKGHRYFRCKPLHGLFARPDSVSRPSVGARRREADELSSTDSTSWTDHDSSQPSTEALASLEFKRFKLSELGDVADPLKEVDESFDVSVGPIPPPITADGVVAGRKVANLEPALPKLPPKSQDFGTMLTQLLAFTKFAEEQADRAEAIEKAAAASKPALATPPRPPANSGGPPQQVAEPPRSRSWLQEHGADVEERIKCKLYHQAEFAITKAAQKGRSAALARPDSEKASRQRQAMQGDAPVVNSFPEPLSRSVASAAAHADCPKGKLSCRIKELVGKGCHVGAVDLATQVLQRHARDYISRKRHDGGMLTTIMRHRNVFAWELFRQVARGKQRLSFKEFSKAIGRLRHPLCTSQARAVYDGCLQEMPDGIDVYTFIAIVEAIQRGRESVAEFAHMDYWGFLDLARIDEQTAAGFGRDATFVRTFTPRHLISFLCPCEPDEGFDWREVRPDLVEVFDELKTSDDTLLHKDFRLAIGILFPRVNAAQALAMSEGYANGTSKESWPLNDFCEVAQALEEGSDVVAEFADMTPDDFYALV